MSGIVISGDTRGGVGGPARQQQQKVPAGAYKQAVAGVLGKLQASWNKGDPKAIGSLFGKEADYVNMGGTHITGADKIAAAHAALFKDAKSETAYRVIKLKPLAPDLVMAFLGQKMTFKQNGKEQTVTTRPSMVMRKIGADWKIVAMQVTRNTAPARAAAVKAAAAKAAPAKPAEAKAAPAKKAAKK